MSVEIEVGLDYAEAFLNYLNSIDGDQEMKTIRKTSYFHTIVLKIHRVSFRAFLTSKTPI